ncbi:hypothetical protein [Actinocatenispora thailandica]|uniref:hypothetical protein n=2 Tax=Actinocatenispora thailandica TaxID=227318 RepID=UPI0031D69E39
MTSPVTRNRVKFELLPLVDKYLDEHPELVRQYSSAPQAAGARRTEPAPAPAKPESAARPVTGAATGTMAGDSTMAGGGGTPTASATAAAGSPAVDDLDIELDDSDLELDKVIDGALSKVEPQLAEQTATELTAADEADEVDSAGAGEQIRVVLVSAPKKPVG